MKTPEELRTGCRHHDEMWCAGCVGHALAEARAAGESAGYERGRQAALCLDQPWPVPDIVSRLVDAVEHLMISHSCDHDGHETVAAARDAAEAFLRALPAGPARTRSRVGGAVIEPSEGDQADFIAACRAARESAAKSDGDT